MKISPRLAAILAVIFSVACLGFAVDGFLSLSVIADPVQAADARGFAWFWMFLAAVAVGFGLLSWRIARKQGEDKNG